MGEYRRNRRLGLLDTAIYQRFSGHAGATCFALFARGLRLWTVLAVV
jgi:hypothetical protein